MVVKLTLKKQNPRTRITAHQVQMVEISFHAKEVVAAETSTTTR